jgi:hypothetical protein
MASTEPVKATREIAADFCNSIGTIATSRECRRMTAVHPTAVNQI